MPVEQFPIFCYYDKQRFKQFGPMDCANWYGVMSETGKRKQALYPAMGRKHIRVINENRLVFNKEPRQIFESKNYFYAVESTKLMQIDKFYNKKEIEGITLSLTGQVWCDFLYVGSITYGLMTDEKNLYIITENGSDTTVEVVTDGNRPNNPQFVRAFGGRFVVSEKGTSNYYLSTGALDGGASGCFTINGTSLFNRASGIIGQFATLHNQLYILCDFVTDILSNIPTQITIAGVTYQFPWKVNTSYNWDYGIADPYSLDVDFGRMCWLANNRKGLVKFMVSDGNSPQDLSTKAIDVLLQRSSSSDGLNPFLESTSDGFLYEYENTIFYRVSAGKYLDFGDLDIQDSANSIEYNFETQKWNRVIEVNGERNRIQKHVFFNNKHLVTVSDDPAMYEMTGDIYYNELRTPGTSPQDSNAFTKYPMRYELTTQIFSFENYAEFVTDWLQIDFVFGDSTFYKIDAPFNNTVYLVDEHQVDGEDVYLETESSTEENPELLIAEGSNTPQFDDNHYYAHFKPHIELYYSDDGGITFYSADVREFSQLGQYRWMMRWYQLGASRNRCYKLVCVSSSPIVILGSCHSYKISSGAAS